MGRTDLWKYCTRQHQAEFLLSLRLLGDTDWPPGKQLACLYAVSNHVEKHYTPQTIEKRDGTVRKLLAPDPLLKKIQRNILHNVLEGLSIAPQATAYHKNTGIRENAFPHRGQKQILKMDIQDFFGSIAFPLVYSRAFPRSYFPPGAAALLTHLCCYRAYLPQGAPTSATVSNLVMKPFDDSLGIWCRERNIVYTRYSDDLTFSGDFDPKAVRNKAERFLRAMGFVVNDSKTQILTAHNRQMVTGIVVNEKPQAPKEYRRKLRQEIYYCRKYGAAKHLAQMNGRQYPLPEPEQVARYLHSLLGKVNFVLYVDPGNEYFQESKAVIQKMMTKLVAQ